MSNQFTKQQEREVLEQIRTIINLLPSDSYVRTAYAGVDQIAEYNIENDWACNPIDHSKLLEQKETEYKKEIQQLEQEIKESLKNEEHLSKSLKESRENLDKWQASYSDTNNELIQANKQINSQSFEILTLKAKLFDYMTKTA